MGVSGCLVPGQSGNFFAKFVSGQQRKRGKRSIRNHLPQRDIIQPINYLKKCLLSHCVVSSSPPVLSEMVSEPTLRVPLVLLVQMAPPILSP